MIRLSREERSDLINALVEAGSGSGIDLDALDDVETLLHSFGVGDEAIDTITSALATMDQESNPAVATIADVDSTKWAGGRDAVVTALDSLGLGSVAKAFASGVAHRRNGETEKEITPCVLSRK